MENEIISSDKQEIKNNESFINSAQENIQYLNLFCSDCFQIPEYTIEINKKSISLIHQCNNVEKKDSFQKNINYLFFSESQCCICQEKCNSICIECKKHICKKCENEHIPKKSENFFKYLIIPFKKKNNEEKNYFYSGNDIQFICKAHYLQYKYFCPCCRINLCNHCKNYHIHTNCPALIDFKVKKNNHYIHYEGSDDIIENLKKLSKVFEECYSNSLKNGKMSLNIILNYSLINEIHKFIRNYVKLKEKYLTKEKLIANTILNNLDESHYLCQNFCDDEFFEKYSILIDNVNNGDFEYHFKLEVLKDFYKNKNRFKINNRLNNSLFYISLKGIIDFFRSQYHYINESITIINSNINNNYLKKEIDNFKLVQNIENFSNFNILDNKNEMKSKKTKENEINNNFINKIKDNKCTSYFRGINEIKKFFNIEENTIINKYLNILKIFVTPQKRSYIESNIRELKNYVFEDLQDIRKSLDLCFKGEIHDVMMEKNEFINESSIKNEKIKEDLENENDFILKGLNKVEPLIDKLLKYLEDILIRLHLLIKQFERFVEKENNNDNKIKNKNPLLFLEEFQSVILIDIKDPDLIQNLYMNYLINFFFYAQDSCEYLKELKNNYKDIEFMKRF